MSSSYRIALNNWLAGLDVKAERLLDIGGSQVSLKPRVKSWDVKKLLVADLPEPHENSDKPDIEMDLNEPFWKDDYVELFDLIFCLEVFDYVWHPAQAMSNISLLLKENGVAWVTFPSVYPLHQPVQDDALRYMPGAIMKLAEREGLEVVQMIKRRPETNGWEKFYRDERMRAAKGEDHNFTGLIVEFRKP